MAVPADVNHRLRHLPKVDEVLQSQPTLDLLARAPRWAVLEAVRREIDALRREILAGGDGGDGLGGDSSDGPARIDGHALEMRVAELLRPSLGRVLNATGVVLHTNLGRAPLAPSAIARMVETSRGYSNLEYRLDEKRRGSRHEHVAGLLVRLTGAEAALAVNNGAAAIMLALGALSAGREVIVSRGELVEIGGSFRIPDVLRAAGARLVEVGTTNRTHLADYERAITEQTAVLLKVHQSNFAMVGFTRDVSVAELSTLARARGLVCVVDLGSGSLLPAEALGIGAEPTVPDVVAAGADVVTFSGDKLLGGPQAGLIAARERLIAPMRAHPLLRALRPGKLTIAALEATLELYRDGQAASALPVLAMLTASRAQLEARALDLQARVAAAAPWLLTEVIEVRGAVGGGAMPLAEPPSLALAVTHPTLGADALEARIRAATPPLIARIENGRLIADVRTLADEELSPAARAFAATRVT